MQRLKGLLDQHTEICEELDRLKLKSEEERISNLVNDYIKNDDLEKVFDLYKDISSGITKDLVKNYILDQLEISFEKNDIMKIKLIVKRMPDNSNFFTFLRGKINEYLLDIDKKIDSSIEFIRISYDMNCNLGLNRLVTFFNTNFLGFSLSEKDKWLEESNQIIEMLYQKKYSALLDSIKFEYDNKVLFYSNIVADLSEKAGQKDDLFEDSKEKEVPIKNKAFNTSYTRSQNLFLLKSIHKEREVVYFKDYLSYHKFLRMKEREDLKFLINKIVKRSMKINITIGNKMKSAIQKFKIENEDEFVFLL